MSGKEIGRGDIGSGVFHALSFDDLSRDSGLGHMDHFNSCLLRAAIPVYRAVQRVLNMSSGSLLQNIRHSARVY